MGHLRMRFSRLSQGRTAVILDKNSDIGQNLTMLNASFYFTSNCPKYLCMATTVWLRLGEDHGYGA